MHDVETFGAGIELYDEILRTISCSVEQATVRYEERWSVSTTRFMVPPTNPNIKQELAEDSPANQAQQSRWTAKIIWMLTQRARRWTKERQLKRRKKMTRRLKDSATMGV